MLGKSIKNRKSVDFEVLYFIILFRLHYVSFWNPLGEYLWQRDMYGTEHYIACAQLGPFY